MGPGLVGGGAFDAIAGALVVGWAARLAEAGVGLATPWPALHAVPRKTATTNTAAIGVTDHPGERFMFILRLTESVLCSR